MKKPTIYVQYKIKDGKVIAGWRYVSGLCTYTKHYKDSDAMDILKIEEDCIIESEKSKVDLSNVEWADCFTDDLYAKETRCRQCHVDLHNNDQGMLGDLGKDDKGYFRLFYLNKDGKICSN